MTRYLEIDFVRGLAVVLMVVFNYSFALNFLGVYSLDLGPLYWSLFPAFIASIFLLVAGISSFVSYDSARNIKTPREIYLKYFRRGVKLFGLGLGITLVTWLTFPQFFIFFGILHLIGISAILSTPFLRFGKLNLIAGSLIIAVGIYLQSLRFDFPWLSWLGLMPSNLQTFDYFPILPWFGVTLVGMSLGYSLYKGGKRRFRLRGFSDSKAAGFFGLLGRNSLLIYIIHQPVLVLFLTLAGVKVF
jgi:uncharacterized membrane protein